MIAAQIELDHALALSALTPLELLSESERCLYCRVLRAVSFMRGLFADGAGHFVAFLTVSDTSVDMAR